MTLKSSSKYTVVNTKLKTEPRITHEDVPRPVIEWGYPMYQEGPIGAGFDVWGSKNLFRPQLLVFGDWRFGLVHNDNGALDTSQIATRLNLNVDLRLTATERIHVFLRPFDRVDQGKKPSSRIRWLSAEHT